MLDMAIEGIADSFDEAFRAAREIEPLTKAAKAPQHGHHHHGQGGKRQRAHGRCAERLQRQNLRQPVGSLGGLRPQDMIDGNLNDLRRQGIEGHAQAGAHQRRHK